MTIQQNFPNIKPTLLLDFANVRALDPRVTFSRASEGRFYGTRTAKAEENLQIRSTTPGGTGWILANATAEQNTADTTAPDGSSTATKLTDDLTSGSHRFSSSAALPGIAINTNYAASVFVKAGTLSFVYLAMSPSSGSDRYVSIVADLSTGTISQTTVSATSTLLSSGIETLANGWFRIWLVASQNTAVFTRIQCGLASAASGNTIGSFGDPLYSGNGNTAYFWGPQVEQRSAVTAYTPTTDQPITNYIPVLQTAGNNVARFDHNPVTGESLGLLIEEQRTNLVVRSEEFDSAAWTKTSSSITADAVVSPDGTVDADKIVSNSGSLGFAAQPISQTSGTSYALSVFAKAGEYSFCQLRISASVSSITRAYFNLSNGTITGAANCTASITPVGNGWYRCSIVYAATVTTGAGGQRIYGQVDASDTVGDGYSGIYIWGAQLEAGASPTSYIPTAASQVTRSADAASMTGTNFSSWYRQDEGTLYGEYSSSVNPVSGVARRVFHVSDGTDNNRIYIAWGETSARALLVCTANGVSQAAISGTAMSASGGKVAGAYMVNNFAASANGLLTGTDADGIIPSVNVLQIGTSAVGISSHYLNGCVKKIAFYPARVTDAQLQALTS